ncbi:MAG TPA: STAS domain-containing protein [Terriglobales bacterium]|nr:STAS domain-containing protein [Terriglobales bacterium]
MADRNFELDVRPGAQATTTVIAVSGKIVMENVPEFRQAWQTLQGDKVIFDLSRVTYMDSSGIGSLVNAHVACANRGRKMAIAGASDRLQRLMSLTQVDKVFRLYPDLTAAESGLQTTARGGIA